jgi:HEPN domain-containing protein
LTLYQRFFEAAKLDMASAKILTEKDLHQPAIYHLQQVYEKCIKSYYIFKEIRIKNTPEDTVYNNLRNGLGNDTEVSTINLLKDMAELEKHAAKDTLIKISDPKKKHILKIFIDEIDKYKSSLDGVVRRRDLKNNYVENIRKYSEYVTSGYALHQNFVNMAISKQPAQTFLYIISCTVNVYPCLYKMESVTRYPLAEFSYENLNLLSNQKDSCMKIIEILDELIHLISKDLK